MRVAFQCVDASMFPCSMMIARANGPWPLRSMPAIGILVSWFHVVLKFVRFSRAVYTCIPAHICPVGSGVEQCAMCRYADFRFRESTALVADVDVYDNAVCLNHRKCDPEPGYIALSIRLSTTGLLGR